MGATESNPRGDDALRRRAEEVFYLVAKLPPEERETCLHRECAGDARLRNDVVKLLKCLAKNADRFLDVPPRLVPAGAGLDEPDQIPISIGRYRVTGVLGRGGMGTVYQAQQEHPHRTVALKVIRDGLVSESTRRRFEREAEVLGKLQHPGIAQIYETGSAPVIMAQGLSVEKPFMVMELVRGELLTNYAASHALKIRQKLELMLDICDAVDYAHSHGVIHRDLKPSNIMVDSAGRPKILDFGVARVTDADVQTVTVQTEPGRLIGTIAYMSPEQIAARPDELDYRSDVYALGVILYELLGGCLPYDLRERSIPEAGRIIREVEPSRLGSIDATLRGDVETIVNKALEKEKARRYQSAAELRADIRRYLDVKPITARPASSWYQLKKFARRNRGLVFGVMAAFVILVSGVLVALLLAHRESRQRKLAQRAEYRARIAAAAGALSYQDGVSAREHLEAVPPEYRHTWEWQHLWLQVDTSKMVLSGHTAGVCAVVFTHNGKNVVSGALDHTVRFWDVQSGESSGTPIEYAAGVRAVAVSPDGSSVAAGCADGGAYVDHLQGGVRISLPVARKAVTSIAFSPDSALIATGSEDHFVRLWDVATGRMAWGAEHRFPVNSLEFYPDGSRILIACPNGIISVCDVASGKCVPTNDLHPNNIYSASLSSDRALIASASGDQTVCLWDASTMQRLRVLEGHSGDVKSVCFSPDGETVASACTDRTVRLWDVGTGRLVGILHGHTRSIERVVFSPDGLSLASASMDGSVRLWDHRPAEAVSVLRGHDSHVYPVAFRPDGAILASGSWDGTVRLWDTRDGHQLPVVFRHEGFVSGLCFSRDGLLASACYDVVRLWDPKQEADIGCLRGHAHWVCAVAFSPDGKLLASASRDGTLRLWDTSNRDELAIVSGHSGEVQCVAFSPLGRRLASGSTDRAVQVFDATNPRDVKVTAILRGHAGPVRAVAFSPDGGILASAADDETIHLWDLSTQAAQHTLRGHCGRVFCLAFNKDGTRLASGADDQTIRLWDPKAGELMGVLRGHRSYVYSVAFSPNDEQLASGSGDKTVRLWHSVSSHTP